MWRLFTITVLCLVFVFPEIAFSGTILPEMTTKVRMSNSDVNRIVCPGNIKDVIFSREKGLTVKIDGHNAFVKFLITKKRNRKTYVTTPSEVYVVCAGDVYSIIAVPKRIPAQTIRLSSGRKKRIKENNLLFSGLAFETRILSLIRSVYTEEIPDSFDVELTDKKYSLFEDIGLTLRRIVTVEGEGLRVKEYIAEMLQNGGRSSAKEIELSEKNFLKTELTVNPIAISIDRMNLKKGDTARVFIVELNREAGNAE